MTLLTCVTLVHAAEPQVTKEQMPRFAAVEPRDAIGTFKIRKGFRIELAAHEPNVVSPVALSFDENGRMYVIEMIDYSERREEKLGRVRLLEDADNDGVFEKSIVFAEGLGWPTAVICYGGGVYVGCSPDIWWMKDTDGDGKADEKKVVYTGFAAGVQRLNVQALLNSFNWGLDNRIHGAASMNGGRVQGSGFRVQGEPVELRGKGFVFDPRSGEFVAENGGGQHGLSFDDWGRIYVCSNSHHIQTFAYDAKYAGRNPHFAMPPALVDIAVDGPAAEVYRASPEEPWRVIRTKWRVSGVVPGIIEGGGRSAGYFTGATGVTIYRGNAYGAEFLGDAFIGDAGGNLVHRKKLVPDGVLVKAQRPADEQKSEFLASTDTWFRPVQFANGPDGCLYVIDMYRETIEHPWSLPEGLKKHLDLNSGNDRGRIWRIVPEGFKRPERARLGGATVEELVKTLGHENGWHRDTAGRLIYERQDLRAVWLIESSSFSAVGRIHALHALKGLGGLKEGHVAKALADEHAQVRRHALRLAEQFELSVKTRDTVAALVDDPDIMVRYQLALSAPALRLPPTDRASLLLRDAASPWMRAAILGGLRDGEAARLLPAVALDLAPGNDAPITIMRELLRIIGARGDAGDLKIVDESLLEVNDVETMLSLTVALGDALYRGGKMPADFPPQRVLGRLVRYEFELGADNLRPSPAFFADQLRLQSYRGPEKLKLDESSLAKEPAEVQLAMLEILDRWNDAARLRVVLAQWPALSPRIREALVWVLVKRPDRTAILLDAIEAKALRAAEIPATHAFAIRQSKDAKIRERAGKLFAVTGRRDDVVKAFSAALDLKGDAKRGRAIYQAKCVSCHRIAGEGSALGPDLETVKNSGREKLLANILDPNREVAPAYTAYIVETKDGDSHIGLLAGESASAVTLRMAYAIEETVSRGDIKSMNSAGLSMMPEGLEEGLDKQSLADLLEFIEKGE